MSADETIRLRAALTAVEARAEKAEGELREVRDAVNAVLDRASGDHIGGVTVVRVPLIRAALSSPSAVTPEPTEDEWNWGDPESDDWTAFSPHPYRNAHRQGMNDCWCGVGPRNEIHRRPVTPEPAEPDNQQQEPDAAMPIDEPWRCANCGSQDLVSISLDEGWTRIAQCVPCGRIDRSKVLGPGWRSVAAAAPVVRKEPEA